MGTGSVFAGVKRLKRGVDHPPLSGAEIKETIVDLDLYSPTPRAFMACSGENFTSHLDSLIQWVLRFFYTEVNWPECEAYFHLVVRL
jgi:hypothetical protein